MKVSKQNALNFSHFIYKKPSNLFMAASECDKLPFDCIVKVNSKTINHQVVSNINNHIAVAEDVQVG